MAEQRDLMSEKIREHCRRRGASPALEERILSWWKDLERELGMGEPVHRTAVHVDDIAEPDRVREIILEVARAVEEAWIERTTQVLAHLVDLKIRVEEEEGEEWKG